MTELSAKFNQQEFLEYEDSLKYYRDIKNSLADISQAVKYLGYAPRYKYKDGLPITVNWFKNTYNNA